MSTLSPPVGRCLLSTPLSPPFEDVFSGLSLPSPALRICSRLSQLPPTPHPTRLACCAGRHQRPQMLGAGSQPCNIHSQDIWSRSKITDFFSFFFFFVSRVRVEAARTLPAEAALSQPLQNQPSAKIRPSSDPYVWICISYRTPI